MAAIAVEDRARLGGLLLDSSFKSHIPVPVDWLRPILLSLSRSVPAKLGGGGIGGMLNVLFTLLGVDGVLPDIVDPLLDPEPARNPALEAGRRKPVARDIDRLPTSSQARTNSSAIWRTSIAGS